MNKLSEELGRWSDANRIAEFWWRDDDAIEPTEQLRRLLSVAVDIPISLSVIPALCEDSLARYLEASPNVAVLQHGYRHANYVDSGAGSEYPAHRCETDVSAEVATGRARLASLFGSRALPVFVPPFHGFDDRFLPLLSANGIRAISRHGARSVPSLGTLVQINAHVGLIGWREPPAFDGDEQAEAAIVGHLKSKRLGQADAHEPTGILTHHLVQDSPSYDFIRSLASVIAAHPAATWLDSRDFFPAS